MANKQAESGPATWVLVVSRDHALRGVEGSFVMANHGKRAPLARMSVGDRVLIYSPKTAHPDGEPLKAITAVGTVTGAEPVQSHLIEDGFKRAADLRAVEPIGLDRIRDHLPLGLLRFGFFSLPNEDSDAIFAMVPAAVS